MWPRNGISTGCLLQTQKAEIVKELTCHTRDVAFATPGDELSAKGEQHLDPRGVHILNTLTADGHARLPRGKIDSRLIELGHVGDRDLTLENKSRRVRGALDPSNCGW
jgi:hypothetical protein